MIDSDGDVIYKVTEWKYNVYVTGLCVSAVIARARSPVYVYVCTEWRVQNRTVIGCPLELRTVSDTKTTAETWQVICTVWELRAWKPIYRDGDRYCWLFSFFFIISMLSRVDNRRILVAINWTFSRITVKAPKTWCFSSLRKNCTRIAKLPPIIQTSVLYTHVLYFN